MSENPQPAPNPANAKKGVAKDVNTLNAVSNKPAPPARGSGAPKPGGQRGNPAAGQPANRPANKPGRSARSKGTAVSEPAGAASLKKRHWAILFSFLLFVIGPVVLVGGYLYTRAADQYASTVAFSVRTEESSSALELLGGITELSGSSSSDTDILFEFLQSQKLVSEIDKLVNLRGMWAKPTEDTIFAFDQDGTIEDLVDYWNRVVNISYDDGAGLIEVRVLAFAPEDATLVAQALFDQSSEMINGLSAIAREDAIRYAREELETSEENLRQARQDVTLFRNIHQLVDPSVDVQTQAGLMGRLEAQLADALIELDLLPNADRPNDPRVLQASRRIEVIQNRLDAERAKLGFGATGSGEVYATLFGDYERLVVDREFAEQSYTSAQITYNAALAESRRQSRYLAAYVLPTLAESSRFPERSTLLGMSALFILLVWSTVILVLYAIKDRR